MKKRKKIKNNINYIIKGMIIGLGFIIPGVSGGVLAVMLGVYDKIICSINNLFKDFKKHCSFLFFIAFGMIISIVLFSKIISFLLKIREYEIKYIFIGLLIGTLPTFIKQIKKDKLFKMNYLVTIISLLTSFLLLKSNDLLELIKQNNIVYLTISGFLYAIGKIVPGISGSALMMYTGFYDTLINLIANPLNIKINDLLTLLPFIISLLISIIILFKLINYLIKKHYNLTYSAIIGFIISSIIMLYPGYNKISDIVIYLILTILSTILSYLLSLT